MEGKEFVLVNKRGASGELVEEIITFDRVYKEWMKNLLCFVRKVDQERNKYSEVILDKGEYHFFGTAEAVADQFFYFLMKDELSEINKNAELDVLCEYISMNEGKIDTIEFVENRNYMITLCTKEFNAMLIGQIYDFYISMWSCFEAAINSMCIPYEKEIEKQLIDSKRKKIIKFLKKCMKDKADDSEIEGIFENNQGVFYKEFPIYVSFPDKINYLFAKILKSYSRDVKKDKAILLFCGKLRNTLHNNGINWKGNEEIEIEGHIFKLKEREKVYYESFQDNMILVNTIFDIYVQMIKAWNRDVENNK